MAFENFTHLFLIAKVVREGQLQERSGIAGRDRGLPAKAQPESKTLSLARQGTRNFGQTRAPGERLPQFQIKGNPEVGGTRARARERRCLAIKAKLWNKIIKGENRTSFSPQNPNRSSTSTIPLNFGIPILIIVI